MRDSERMTTIRALNDQLRRFGIGGTIVVTSGIQALGRDRIAELMVAIAPIRRLLVRQRSLR